MKLFDFRRENYRPNGLGDTQHGYVFDFVQIHDRSFALVRGVDGKVIWRSRSKIGEPPSKEYPLETFTHMEQLVAHEIPEYWTMQLRAKALASSGQPVSEGRAKQQKEN